MYPGERGLKSHIDGTLWGQLYRDARVYLFTFDRPQLHEPAGEESITDYALDLLGSILSSFSHDRPIHFAAHSTGGLVVKRALLLALDGRGNGQYLPIVRSCFSVAFFGTPRMSTIHITRGSNKLTRQDHGARVLSQKKFESGITEALELDRPIESSLREEIRNIDHLDALQQFDKKFVQLALGLQKIWSFYEAKETMLRVKVRSAMSVAGAHNSQAESDVMSVVS